MLAQTLQWLEGDGLVSRRAFDVVPPHVEYSLTPFGHEAAQHVQALADWIESNLPRFANAWSAGPTGPNGRGGRTLAQGSPITESRTARTHRALVRH